MEAKMKVALIQMTVKADKQTNLDTAARYVHEAAYSKADMAILPEMFCCPYQTNLFPDYAELQSGPTFQFLSNLAAKEHIYLVAGSVPEIDLDGHVFNTSYIFQRDGGLISKHRKMHLFDIAIEGGQHFMESETLTKGNDITVFDTEFGPIGVAICYDIRFPELIRIMADQGAKVIVVPASFNMTTGPAHWELLFRSRAVDNQVYMIGVSTARNDNSSYISYGNSVIVSPWGEVLHKIDEKESMLVAELDMKFIDKIRNELPLLKHRRSDLYVTAKRKE